MIITYITNYATKKQTTSTSFIILTTVLYFSIRGFLYFSLLSLRFKLFLNVA